MREILFRGKRVDNGEWVYGGYSYCEKDNTHYITNMGLDHISHIGFHQEIIPETVGQYTGLTDKNGTKIFGGDILHIHSDDFEYDYKTEVGTMYGYSDVFSCVKGDFGDGDFAPLGWAMDYFDNESAMIEVIGNIHDNPELLEDKK